MTISDWWMVGVTLGAGVLSALATVLAVIYTHRKTSTQYEETMKINEQRYADDVKRNEQRHAAELKRYDEDKKRQEREMALAIIKPSLKYAALNQIRDKLIVDGNEERMLFLSSKEGFEFYDDIERQREYHYIFSIRNESRNDIQHVNIIVSSTLKTKSDKEIPDEYKNVVKLLRKNEEVLLRIHSSEQRKELLERLEKNETVITEFGCTINYLTFANQQIRYEYAIKITDTPKDRKTEISKDGHTPMDDISIDINEPASVLRDLQENLRADRFGYKYRRIGEEQMNGTIDALEIFWMKHKMDEMVNNVAKTAESMDKSMQDVARATDEQRKFFENMVIGLKKNNENSPPLIEAGEAIEETNQDET